MAISRVFSGPYRAFICNKQHNYLLHLLHISKGKPMKCINCNKDFESKRSDAKYCSSKCRVQASRKIAEMVDPAKDHNRSDLVVPTGEQPLKPSLERELTETDQLFEDEKPDYYRYTDKFNQPNPVFERKCIICKQDFITQAGMRKFCSPDCYSAIMVAIAGKGLTP